ncbi:MAG: signal recognition particle protein [Deltaproteobacteria bacterium]|nr:signal recognition particle protein [Deltaproteobacteria bacterium]
MFDKLTERLTGTFKKLSGGAGLSEAQVDEGLKEIRRSLLEADVHFRVAREVCDKIREKALGQKVWEKLSPGQQVVQIFHDELVAVLGGVDQQLPAFAGKPPVVVLIAGLQGSGKTTFSAKLALYLTKKLRKTVGILPADCARPAAKEQLLTLARRIDVPAFDSPIERGAVEVARQGLAWAQKEFFDVLIVDTAGRQQVDDELMTELADVEKILAPQEKFLVLDSMIGSQGLEVARTFNEKVRLTGLILAKLDGDSRGGVALSARSVTGLPIYFAGVGEKPEDLEAFHPSRMAQRILGMGDVMTLIEKAKESISEEDAMASAEKMMGGRFNLEDFRDHLRRMKSMGPLEGLMKLIPGMGQAMQQMKGIDPEKEMKRIEAIINSMTREERGNHGILNGRRRERIAKGSGTTVAEINRFIKQFVETQKMMKQLTKLGLGGKGKAMAKMAQMAKTMKGGGGFPGGGFPGGGFPGSGG